MTHRSHEPRVAIFPGSFNPWTKGHQSILERGLQMFDSVVVMVGVNPLKSSPQRQQSLEHLHRCLDGMERVSILEWDGLTVDAARSVGARFMLRGVRSVADFEYERNLADVNHMISGLETVLLISYPEYSMISSSVVRELQSHGADVSQFIP